MPTHITTNGPRLHTQLRSEAAAADGAAVEGMAAAVIAFRPNLIVCPRRHLPRGPACRPRSIGSSSSLMRTGTR